MLSTPPPPQPVRPSPARAVAFERFGVPPLFAISAIGLALWLARRLQAQP